MATPTRAPRTARPEVKAPAVKSLLEVEVVEEVAVDATPAKAKRTRKPAVAKAPAAKRVRRTRAQLAEAKGDVEVAPPPAKVATGKLTADEVLVALKDNLKVQAQTTKTFEQASDSLTKQYTKESEALQKAYTKLVTML